MTPSGPGAAGADPAVVENDDRHSLDDGPGDPDRPFPPIGRPHSIDAVTAELTALGFSRISLHRQFVWPMAAHRAIGRLWLSRTAEAGARALRLQHLTGGPVLICASRPD